MNRAKWTKKTLLLLCWPTSEVWRTLFSVKFTSQMVKSLFKTLKSSFREISEYICTPDIVFHLEIEPKVCQKASATCSCRWLNFLGRLPWILEPLHKLRPRSFPAKSLPSHKFMPLTSFKLFSQTTSNRRPATSHRDDEERSPERCYAVITYSKLTLERQSPCPFRKPPIHEDAKCEESHNFHPVMSSLMYDMEN